MGANSEITIFASLPHTHNAGISLYSTVVRDNIEIEYIANNKYFSNAFQVNIKNIFCHSEMTNILFKLLMYLINTVYQLPSKSGKNQKRWWAIGKMCL